jgi:hypothetical protein
VKAARAKVPVDRSDTPTGNISAALERLRGRLPDQVLDGLAAEIRGIERTISLQAAREAVEEAESTS